MPPRGTAPGLSTTDGDARYQPLDSDLTAIAEQGTTPTGRNKLIEAAPIKDPASPYTIAAEVRRIVFTAGTAATINLVALSELDDLEIIWVQNQSESTVVFTVDPPAGAFLDTGGDGVSANYTVLARGGVGFQRLSATTWGSVQLSALTPTGARGYILSGVPYMVATAMVNGVSVDVGAPVAATSSADPSGFLATMSGADLTVPIGAHSASSLQSAGQYWSWSLSSLGVTPPSGVFRARVRVQVTGFTDGSRAGIQHVAVGLGTGPTTLAKALGFSRPSSGTAIGYSGTSTSGTPANATGADTTREIRGSILCGATTSVGFGAERYSAASAIESVNDLTAGAGLAATPTTVTLYAHRQTASSTSDWVLLGLTWSVAWAGL